MARIKILTRKELCALMSIDPATMRKYISKARGHLVECGKYEINVYNTKNQQWIVDYCDRKDIDYKPIFAKSDKKITKAKPTVQKLIVDSELNQKQVKVISESTNARSLLNTKALEKKIELDNINIESKKIELEKKKGKVLPTDFVIEILGNYINTNITGIKTNVHTIIDSIVDELGGDYEAKLKYKKESDLMITNTFKKNHESITKDSIKKAGEYALSTKW